MRLLSCLTMSGVSGATILKGLILGWSVAWPPGPINAEMIRRALIPRSQGGGFWTAYQLGLGACSGDFCWALGVAAGAGALLASPRLHLVLGLISFSRGAPRGPRASLTRRPCVFASPPCGVVIFSVWFLP